MVQNELTVFPGSFSLIMPSPKRLCMCDKPPARNRLKEWENSFWGEYQGVTGFCCWKAKQLKKGLHQHFQLQAGVAGQNFWEAQGEETNFAQYWPILIKFQRMTGKSVIAGFRSPYHAKFTIPEKFTKLP